MHLADCIRHLLWPSHGGRLFGGAVRVGPMEPVYLWTNPFTLRNSQNISSPKNRWFHRRLYRYSWQAEMGLLFAESTGISIVGMCWASTHQAPNWPFCTGTGSARKSSPLEQLGPHWATTVTVGSRWTAAFLQGFPVKLFGMDWTGEWIELVFWIQSMICSQRNVGRMNCALEMPTLSARAWDINPLKDRQLLGESRFVQLGVALVSHWDLLATAMFKMVEVIYVWIG